MPYPARGLACAVLALLGSLPAAAAAEPAPSGAATTGVTLRLVAEPARDDGTLRAALLVDLAPGWKTYWLDPGEAGIPPRLDLSASRNLEPLETAFPVPHRLREPGASSNGYSQPMAVALRFKTTGPAPAASVRLRATLGVCRRICIPVTAELAAAPRNATPADARLVASAFEALALPSTPDAGIVAARLSADGAALEVEALAGAGEAARTADLFVAGPDGWFFGAPEPPRREGARLVFAVPIAERPRSAGQDGPAVVDAILTLGASAYGATGLAVSGR